MVLPHHVELEHPWRLVALLVVVPLVAGFVLAARRRRRSAQAYADVDLLPAVAPHRPGWRRLPAQVATLLAMVVLVFGWAQPTVLADDAVDRSVVVLVLDTSTSMTATDVDPDRLTAATQAATDFLDGLPDQVQVALVTFNRTSSLRAGPTADHDLVVAALRDLPTAGGTAQGDGILTALDAVQRALPPSPPGVSPAARIVLLSDGVNTEGTPIPVAEQRATEARVPVSTIAIGTVDGTVEVDGQIVPVPVDASGLQQIAESTGGTAYTAADRGGLADVYDDIGTQVETLVERRPIADQAMGVALGLLALGAVPSVLMLGRVG
jgi:Ca-activated chloride channel family protein